MIRRSPLAPSPCAAFAALLSLASPVLGAGVLHDPREVHLADVVQLTAGGENAEAYWSPDGERLIFQSTRPPYACDQMFTMSSRAPETPALVSTGRGRTTCGYYFYPGAERLLFASTHAAGDACPPPPDMSKGYVWRIDPGYDIWTAKPDGSDLKRLTDSPGYDAEATVCPVDGRIVFTSTRDGDLEIYTMNADGSNVARVTNHPGYDGGGFFSADCSRIVWRSSRPAGAALDEYRALLAEHLVRPSQLDIWVADADGKNARQVTKLGVASFAPYFFPNGRRILFSSNYGDPKGREFDIWAVDVSGENLERITYTGGFDGFPVFSPDGKRLAFGSNRNQGKPGETDVYVARWIETPAAPAAK
jgi:Tol biopolymer transport system component